MIKYIISKLFKGCKIGLIKKYARYKFLSNCARRNSDLSLTTINLENYDNLKIGNNIVLNDAFLDTNGVISIGDNAFFGWNVKILTGTHDYRKYGLDRQQAIKSKPVIIEEGVWIGSYAIIFPGSHIGKHSVVSAGSVVSGNVEPFTVVGGNPATILKKIE